MCEKTQKNIMEFSFKSHFMYFKSHIFLFFYLFKLDIYQISVPQYLYITFSLQHTVILFMTNNSELLTLPSLHVNVLKYRRN